MEKMIRKSRRGVALLLVMSIVLMACSRNVDKKETKASESEKSTEKHIDSQKVIDRVISTDFTSSDYAETLTFSGLDDANLQSYVENAIYYDVLEHLDTDKYIVQDIESVFISQEYINALNLNSKENVYFGHTLSELNEMFGGKKFVFSIDAKGNTVVEEYKESEEGTNKGLNSIIKNVAIGTGVILVCVTVSAVSGGLGAPAVSVIFACSAKTATIMATTTGGCGGLIAGISSAVITGDPEQALKDGLSVASEGFKYGAIAGALIGGAAEGIALKGATANGLSMNQVALILKESKYPLDVIKQIHNMSEYEALKVANLKPAMIGGKIALIRNDIDLNIIDELGRTNLERMKQGLSPIDITGKSYELHHIGQEINGTLAVLTDAEHNNQALHMFKKISEIDRPEFAKVRSAFWKEFAGMVVAGGI